MKVLIASDITLTRDGDRVLVSSKMSTILRRYAAAFGSLILHCRVARASGEAHKNEDLTDIVEEVIPISSLTDTLLHRNEGRLKAAISACDLVICRCPSLSAYRAGDLARKMGKPYMTESMGDPWDAYWNHGLKGKAIAVHMYRKMRSVVGRADYAVYVTTEFLQKRYPCGNPSIAASNVLLKRHDPAALEARLEKLKSFDPARITLMTTAAVDIWYKGHIFVIQAIPKLNDLGIRVRYLIVGEGRPDDLQNAARQAGVSDQVVFTGRLPLEEVFARLDEADLYLQPSLQEGLPRSVIEAMSRGCACIGARTAGIPELLPPEMVVKRKSADDIVEKIRAWVDLPPERKALLARRNWQEAGQYTAEILDARRNAYFQKIRKDLGK